MKFRIFIFFKEPVHNSSQKTLPQENAPKYSGFEPPSPDAKAYLRFLTSSFTKPYLACFVVSFVQNFDFAVLEAMVTPFTKANYKFGPLQNSILFSAISVEMIIIILVTSILSHRIQDRIILLFGEIFMGAGVILGFFFMNSHTPFHMFCITVGVLVLGLPSQSTAVMGAYAKLLTQAYGHTKQGLYTGVIMVFGSLGNILGPLWAGYTHSLHLLYGLLIIMWAIELITTLIFFQKLDPKKTHRELAINNEYEALLAIKGV